MPAIAQRAKPLESLEAVHDVDAYVKTSQQHERFRAVAMGADDAGSCLRKGRYFHGAHGM